MRNILACLVFLAACSAASAAELFGTVDAMSGTANVVGQDKQSNPLAEGMKVYEGDTILTGHEGEVHIVTEDGAILALRPDTVVRVDGYKAEGGDDDKTLMSLLSGSLRSITGWIGKHNNSAYRITTPTATIGVRGTDHEVTVIEKGDGDEPGTYDTVNEGTTVIKTPHGEAAGAPGKFVFAPRGRAAAPAVLTRRPRFLEGRHLRMEGRIVQRKEYLRGRFEQMREERGRHFRQVRAERREGQHEELRAAGRQQERPQAMERRQEMQERRSREQRRGEEMREQRRQRMQKNGEEGNAQRRSEKRHGERRRERE